MPRGGCFRLWTALINHPINYVTGAAYNAPGLLTASTYGQNGSFTGILNTLSYNSRKSVADFIKWFPHTGPPAGQPESAPWCQCMPLPSANSNTQNKNSNNSNQNSTENQSSSGNGNKGTSGGPRAGKPFTPKGKNQVKAENAAANGGQTTCENCGQSTVPGQQSKAGVTPPGNETQVDHAIPQSKGGDGSPPNGQVLCRTCNINKSDKVPPL